MSLPFRPPETEPTAARLPVVLGRNELLVQLLRLRVTGSGIEDGEAVLELQRAGLHVVEQVRDLVAVRERRQPAVQQAV